MPDLLIDTEFRSFIPPLRPEELAGLKNSLLKEGNRDSIVIWKETRTILDGHNRYDLCQENGIKLKDPLELSFPDRNAAMVWIIRNQFGRRNLNPYQRSVLALKLEEILEDEAAKRMRAGKKPDPTQKSAEGETRDQIAKIADVSHDTIDKVKIIEAKANPEQKAKLIAGTTTINQITQAIKREEIKEMIKQAVWPTGKYRIIYADPPWKYSNSMPNYFTDQSDYYQLMTIEDICNLPVRDLACENSALFLWVTSPILEESFRVINSWGFKYKACFVWDKIKHNMGHYNSVRHELLLVAVRGSCQPDEMKLFDSVQTIERNGHSQKPEVFREIIDTLYPYGPRIELFATRRVDGWEAYGNNIAPGQLSEQS